MTLVNSCPFLRAPAAVLLSVCATAFLGFPGYHCHKHCCPFQVDVAVVEANDGAEAVQALMQSQGMQYVGRVELNDWFVRRGLSPNVTALPRLTGEIRRLCQAAQTVRRPLPRPKSDESPHIPKHCGPCLQVELSEHKLHFSKWKWRPEYN